MKLLDEIRACTLCEDVLPCPPRPILQFSSRSKILLIGQAPGIKAHESQRPWNDKSGERLRDWLQIPSEIFYDPHQLAIVPMGFCYPGRGKSGDNPPRPECKLRWLDIILCHLQKVQLKVLVGSYAVEHFLGKGDLSARIREHADHDSPYLVLPHPSPRNNIWLAKNPWFERDVLPAIRNKTMRSLGTKGS